MLSTPLIPTGGLIIILRFRDDYYSRITRRYHKGEVNPMFGIAYCRDKALLTDTLPTSDFMFPEIYSVLVTLLNQDPLILLRTS
jgi:hypothetical protein